MAESVEYNSKAALTRHRNNPCRIVGRIVGRIVAIAIERAVRLSEAARTIQKAIFGMGKKVPADRLHLQSMDDKGDGESYESR